MFSSKPVTKLEDCDSDTESGDEGKITLSLSHWDSEYFLTKTESEEENPAQNQRL